MNKKGTSSGRDPTRERSEQRGRLPRDRIERAVRRVFAPRLGEVPGDPGEGGRSPAGPGNAGALGERGLGPLLGLPARAVDRLARVWWGTLRLVFPLGHVSLGNTVRVLTDGDEVFDAMWAAIDAAKRKVRMTTYILDPDRVGRRTLSALTLAARRGVDVTLVVDAFGSHRLQGRDLSELRAAGGTVVRYNPLLGRRHPVSRLVRNHQKILVIDREQAFVGGLNISDDYAGKRLGGGVFRDTTLRVEGPAARALDRLAASRASEESNLDPVPDRLEGIGTLVEVLESNVRRHRRAIQRATRTTLRRAVHRCWMTTPYFVPPLRLRNQICRASRRGVDVRILTAGRSDVRVVHLASQHLYGHFLRVGVRVFELEGRILHAKTMTIDGVFATVGSFNLDRWSDRRNLEVSVCVLDRALAGDLDVLFERDLRAAREITLAGWKKRTLGQRILHWCAYQLMRL